MINSERQKLGLILKHARHKHGFTQSEVAEKLGVTFQAISNYERGINNVDNDTLEKLCTLYEIPFRQMIDSIDYRIVAEKLKTARTKKRFTQKKVSELSGIPLETVRSYESGTIEIPIHEIKLFCGLYGIEVSSIIEQNILFFRSSNVMVFQNITSRFIELAADLRKIADDIEHLNDGEDEHLRDISIKFKLEITEFFDGE